MPSLHRQLAGGRRARFERLETRLALSVNFDLLADLNTAPETAGSAPMNFQAVGETLYFFANTPEHGYELWTSDGTASGTRLVKDVRPGYTGSVEQNRPPTMASAGGRLYFTADDGVHGFELWTSDGTAAGTKLVRDIWPGSFDGVRYSEVVGIDGVAYFSANGGLWRSDGTEDGTYVLLGSNGEGYQPDELVDVDGTLYFAASGVGVGRELWRSDGTVGGTYIVKDIHTGGASSSPQELTSVGGVLYFNAYDGVNGRQVWTSDGTAAGTRLVKAVHVGSEYSGPQQLTDVNGRLFFVADDGVHGREVWSTDGTAEGTAMTQEIYPGIGNPYGTYGPLNLTAVGDVLYFTADDSSNGYALWRSDGTAEGTTLVADVSTSPSSFYGPHGLTNVNGELYFFGDGGNAVNGLWKTDGTPEGTVEILSSAGNRIQWGGELMVVGDSIFFRSNDGAFGSELWMTDGTSAGTRIVKDILGGTRDANISNLAKVDGTLFFNTLFYDEVFGSSTYGAWRTNDALTGVVPFEWTMTRLRSEFFSHKGAVYFVGYDEAHGAELWTMEGAHGTPRMVKDIRTGWNGSNLSYFVSLGDYLFFTAYDDTFTHRLWRTDGTEAGTEVVKGFGPQGSVYGLVAMGNELYFTAKDGVHGHELWKSDGTTAGTVLVKDIAPGATESGPTSLTAMNGRLYFWADDGTHGAELWSSDGTTAGTALVLDIRPGAAASLSPLTYSPIVQREGVLFFRANDGDSGDELWTSDGTAGGTTRLKDIRPGGASSSPQQLTSAGNYVFFSADDGVHGSELWRTDGTIAGTQLVKDIRVGADPQLPSNRPWLLTDIEGTLYFTADDGIHGVELWSSSGTESGTTLVHDFARGAASSNPQSVVLVQGRLAVVAATAEYGQEVWLERLPSPGDFDGDGFVTGNDFLAWQRGLGSTGAAATLEAGNADGDADVDAEDLEAWKHAAAPIVPIAVVAADHAVAVIHLPLSAVDAVFAAGDFTGLIAGNESPSATRGKWRPGRRVM
jgi:ELWxxDGT repeat protein